MRAGTLQHRGTLETFSETENAIGEIVPSWQFHSRPWVGIRPLSGRELVEARASDPRITHELTLRYAKGVNSQMRLVWNDRGTDRTFNFRSVLETAMGRDEVKVLAEEDVDA